MRRSGFFYELKRRRVWRVAGAYALVVWMAVEIILETAPVLGLPGWVPRATVILAFVGFPVTLALAWAFDLTAHGVVRTPAIDPADAGDPEAPPPAAYQGPARLAGVFGAGILVALVGFGAYSVIHPTTAIRPEAIQSVAVLPFADLSPEGDQRYFADGVTEELINRLARVGELQVVGRTSSFAFRGEARSLSEIARELGVDAVIEGSVRRSGERLRVTVELIDAGSGFQLWSEKYDRTAEDIFAIQDDISSAIVEALRVQLVPGTSDRRAGTESIRAHDAYLLGLARWHVRTEEDLLRALDYFETAVAEDGSYAPAHAGLALTYAVLPTYSEIPADVAAERGAEAAARALALDAQNAEAHAAIGQIAQGLEWNLEMAEMAYRRALEFRPSFATGHQWHAETLLIMGRLEEARREIDRALDLDPLSVSALYTRAYLQTVRREYDAARASFELLLARHPGFLLGHRGLVLLCLAADCHDQADLAARAGYEPELAGVVRAVIAADRRRAGEVATSPGSSDQAAAAEGLEGIRQQLDPAHLALLHAAIGDRERALDRVEQAYEEGEDPNLPFFLVHPLFDDLRREPRFTVITRALGVEAPLATLPAR